MSVIVRQRLAGNVLIYIFLVLLLDLLFKFNHGMIEVDS